MTEKNNAKKSTAKKQTKKPDTVKKRLYELVNNCDMNKAQLMGLLTKAGLYYKYLDEESKKNKEVIPATITEEEFKKVIGE